MTNNNIILSIHYHKTGCMLSIKLYRLFNKYLNKKLNFNKIVHKKNIIKKSRKFINNNNNDNNNNEYIFKKIKNIPKNIPDNKYIIYNQAAPNFFFDIFKEMPNINKVVHFVREPYDWCISNYLYHTQKPTPEKWFLNVNNDINTWFDIKKLTFLADKINLDFKYIQNIIDYIKSIYDCDKNMSYYKYLLKCPKEKSLIIETSRFLLKCCDHFRMTIISKLLKPYKDIVKTFTINDFKEPNIKKTIPILTTFLFNNKLKSSNNKIINDYLNMYHKSEKGNHVTHNIISKNDRLNLINVLKNNEHLSYLLNHLN